LFVRDEAASHASQRRNGGPATSNESVRTDIDPVHMAFPASEMLALKIVFDKLTDTFFCSPACCDMRQPAAIAGHNLTSTSAIQ
jgi:hypothetical protein